MKFNASADAIIIGGGFSGTMLAAQLARRGKTSILVEGYGRAGRGTAFSTPETAHLLNVPAAKMSAWPDLPDDFAQQIASEDRQPTDFVQRRRFGAYLCGILASTLASGLAKLLDGHAVAAKRAAEGWTVTLADGSQIAGRSLILAQGNQPPAPLRSAKDVSAEQFINDPWSDAGREAVGKLAKTGGDIVIVGTGLTMVDVCLSLAAAGHRGKIVAVSRRGLMPRAHAPFSAAPVDFDDVPSGSVTALGRWLRRRGAESNWRGAVDSLRPHSHPLWRAFSLNEKRRFLRHARPWWDVHRHRIAPEVASTLKQMQNDGRLEIIAGRIASMRDGNVGLEVGIKRRGTSEVTALQFDLGVNCTGPLGAIGRSEDGVLTTLFEAGLATPDELGMGLAVDCQSRVVGADRLWAVGPLTKGALWEIVAVPDIRGQVADVAEDVAKELDR